MNTEANTAGSFRAGFVAVLGRPSSGKSTLLNCLCGNKIAITSPKPQTTRQQLRGILNRPQFQIVFLDTPGYTQIEEGSTDRQAKNLREELYKALDGAELLLYIMDLSRDVGREEQELLDLVKNYSERKGLAVVIAQNKMDLIAEEKRAKLQAERHEMLEQHFSKYKAQVISAKKQEGIEELLSSLVEFLPEGEPMYSQKLYTDQVPDFRVGELIREQVLPYCGQELPYSVYVEVFDLEYRPLSAEKRKLEAKHGQGMEEEEELWIRASIQVERESQKGILIGKGGVRIKEIRRRARREIRKVFQCAVELDLQVKVDYKWTRNSR